MKKSILLGILIFITVIVIELCCICALEGNNISNYLEEFWSWYKTLLKL